ncbi:MAG: YnfA family protein [Actinobacteria bacterium]|nr:YnfA family protein [Actinomycetota bacterium]
MTVIKSIALFVAAAIAEIGGVYLVWQGVRERRGLAFVGVGVIALGLYGLVATFQPSPHFGRILAAYGGVFVVGSLLWGVVFDGFRPDRYDIIGAAICIIGIAVIMYAPRAGQV